MKKVVFDLELSWTDLNGICHNVLIHRFRLLPGDQVESCLKFTVLGDEMYPVFDPVDGDSSADCKAAHVGQLPS